MNYLFPKKIKERKRTLSVEETIISEQAAFLCQKYIEARFTRSNLCYYNPKSRKRDGEPTIACSEDVVNTLNEMGALLEKSYPKLYNNVLDQLNWRINLAILVCNMFNRVSEQIIAYSELGSDYRCLRFRRRTSLRFNTDRRHKIHPMSVEVDGSFLR